MNKRYYEHTLPIIRGSLSNTYTVSSIVIFKSSIYRLASLSLAVLPSDFCATADHDSDRRYSFVGISYLCPEIVTRHERGDSFSFVLPFLIQKRTLKVCFFWLIIAFF